MEGYTGAGVGRLFHWMGGSSTSVAVHFHLEDSWSGIAIFAGPLIFLFSFFISSLLQAFKIERN